MSQTLITKQNYEQQSHFCQNLTVKKQKSRQLKNMLFKLKDKKTHNTLKNHIVTRQKTTRFYSSKNKIASVNISSCSNHVISYFGQTQTQHFFLFFYCDWYVKVGMLITATVCRL